MLDSKEGTPSLGCFSNCPTLKCACINAQYIYIYICIYTFILIYLFISIIFLHLCAFCISDIGISEATNQMMSSMILLKPPMQRHATFES